ncbi:MAG: conjugated bile salt MFS transporter, partial [Peptostreptococcaceae bacterium]
MNSNHSEKKFFYGWVILVCCMLIQAIPFGVAANIQPQFIDFVVKGEGFTLTQFSLMFTIGTVVSAVASPFIGSMLSNPKVNFKLIYLIGAVFVGVGFASFSVAKGIWSFYIIASVVNVGNAIISAIGVPLLINSWFKYNKGTAMGIAFSGGGIGNMFLQAATATLLATKGYRYAYFVFGVLALVVAVPIALFLMRMPKSKEELDAYVPKKNSKSEKKEVAHWGYSFAEVKNIKFFWILAIGFVFVGLYVSAMAIQYMGYFYAQGLTAKYVGLSGSIFAFFSIFGNLFGGVLFDKMGVKNSLLLAGILVLICGGCLIFLPQFTFLGYLYSALFGIAMYAYIVGPSYLTGTLFGNREYGTILGIIQVFFALGFACGSSIFGVIVDMSGGSYMMAWVFATASSIVAYALLIFASTSI